MKKEYFNTEDDNSVRCEVDILLKHTNLVNDGGFAKKEEEKAPKAEKILTAVLRFMIRYLAGDLDLT